MEQQLAFQSTLPVKGATNPANTPNPHPIVSIHAPSEGSDAMVLDRNGAPVTFQSTLPVKGATYAQSAPARSNMFQSTLPVKGATEFAPPAPTVTVSFNPRSQ